MSLFLDNFGYISAMSRFENSPKDNSGFQLEEGQLAPVELNPQGLNETNGTAANKDDNSVEMEEKSERGYWHNEMEFILSCIGWAVGLGNVWRFPYQCYQNGGGCFLVVYWILSACVGFPLVFLEHSLGQYTSQGPMHCWGFAPIVRGVGMSMVAISAIVSVYYNVIIAWALFMLFASFQSVLPFTYCDFDSWADFRCEMRPCNGTSELSYGIDGLCYNTTYLDELDNQQSYYNLTSCPNTTSQHQIIDVELTSCINFFNKQFVKSFRNTSTVAGFWNEQLSYENNVDPQLSTDQYFHHYVLRRYDGYSSENIGTPSWGLALTLLLAWVLVFLCLINGIHSSGKVAYFSSLFPYVVLIILIGRGVTLPGAYKGIMFFLTPDFAKLKEPKVWFAAANQLFYSMGGTWGSWIALASYNKFNSFVLRDSLITAFADSFTSFIAGFAIFSIIGFGSELLGKPVDQVAQAGSGLAFVMYPKILLELPGSVAWSIAFFSMLLFLGLDSEFNSMETVLTAALDFMPYFRGTRLRKACFVGGLCAFFYLMGLPIVCNGGYYLTQAIDLYSSSFGLFIIGIVELLSISWIYGSRHYHNDLRLMLGPRWKDWCYYYITAFWGFISPAIITAIFFYSAAALKPVDTNSTDEAIGWLCAIFVVIWIPLIAIYELITTKSGGSFLQRLRYTSTPTREWGPWLVKDRRRVLHLGPDFDVDPRNFLQKKTDAPTPDYTSPGQSASALATEPQILTVKYNDGFVDDAAGDATTKEFKSSYL